MVAERVQADYDALNDMARYVDEVAEALDSLDSELHSTVEQLGNGDWRGRGAEAFLDEMASELFPAMGRLRRALRATVHVIQHTSKTFSEAEEEAARLFQGEGSGVVPGGGPVEEATRGTFAVTALNVSNLKLAQAGTFIQALKKKDPNALDITGWQRIDGPVFVQGLGDSRAIHPNDISQAQLGDCFLMASMMAVARSNPGLIENMITSNPNGTYTVWLYNSQGVRVPITVTPDFPTGPAGTIHAGAGDWVPAFTGPAQNEIWPMLVEKAYAQMIGNGDAAAGYKALHKGGKATDAMFALTGKRPEVKSPSDVGNYFFNVNMGGGSLIINTFEAAGDKKALYNGSNLVGNHSYVVTNVDLINREIWLRNPWGWGDKPIKVPLADVSKYFSSLIVPR